jgi:hypothetical protein
MTSLRAGTGNPEGCNRGRFEVKLGSGDVGIALYVALSAGSFEGRLRIAVTHSGECDGTAAIAGNLPGLLNPDEVQAQPWRSNIEGADLIERLARDLVALSPTEDDLVGYPG